MNKKIVSIVAIIILVIIGFWVLYFYLASSEQLSQTPTVNQGLKGKVTLFSGNCMPMVRLDKSEPSECKTTNVSRAIYIRESVTMGSIGPTYLKEKTGLVKQVQSDKNGNYQVELPVGTYSVFVEDDGKEYCGLFNAQGEGFVACRVTVRTGMVEYNIKIDHASW